MSKREKLTTKELTTLQGLMQKKAYFEQNVISTSVSHARATHGLMSVENELSDYRSKISQRYGENSKIDVTTGKVSYPEEAVEEKSK